MCRTDLLQDLAVQPALNASQRIPAQDTHVVRTGYLIRECLDLDRRFGVALCPQKMRTFSENCDADLLSLGRVRCLDEITKEVQETNWIGHTIEHECRERLGSIHRDVSTLLNSGRKIHAMCLQSWKKAVSVLLSCDHNCCFSGLESGTDELREVIQKTCVIRIE